MPQLPARKYLVLVDDHAHYMDETERYQLGEFESVDDAVGAAQALVDQFLAGEHRPGMSVDQLFSIYTHYGPDPFIPGIHFSAWDYARERCVQLCSSLRDNSDERSRG
jgi:hypothetical protein